MAARLATAVVGRGDASLPDGVALHLKKRGGLGLLRRNPHNGWEIPEHYAGFDVISLKFLQSAYRSAMTMRAANGLSEQEFREGPQVKYDKQVILFSMLSYFSA